jgi:heparan-alpha-glucosaminide N-acetyltransferase
MAWERPTGNWKGVDLATLGLDEALLEVTHTGDGPVNLYALSSNCHACPWQLGQLPEVPALNSTYTLHTHHPWRFLVTKGDQPQPFLETGGEAENTALCAISPTTFGQFGVYQLEVLDCSLTTAIEPVDSNLALLVWFLVMVGVAALWAAIKNIPGIPGFSSGRLRGWLGWDTHAAGEQGGKVRLRSLDTFRGIAIVLMIFVNDGGGGYWFMEHSTWNGLYGADLVFPWFLWIMGVCIPMSVKSSLKREASTGSVIWQVTVRSIKLLILGFILNSFSWITLSKLRVPGVLQRFGICYFVVSLVGFCFSRTTPSKVEWAPWAADLVHLWPQWLVMLLLLAVHQIVVYLVPAPGCQVRTENVLRLDRFIPRPGTRARAACTSGPRPAITLTASAGSPAMWTRPSSPLLTSTATPPPSLSTLPPPSTPRASWAASPAASRCSSATRPATSCR